MHPANLRRNFLLVRNGRWRHGHVVLLGDALHTAHFSIGSGTKLALEDSVALAYSLMMRSGKVDPDNLRKRGPRFVTVCEAAAAKRPASF